MNPESILREVSRSFYLSLRILPADIRKQVSLAYLLARASDTVADTKALSRERRLEVLRLMRSGDFCSVSDISEGPALPAERLLLENMCACAKALAELSPEDQKLIQELLDTIISGQIFDLEKFPGEDAGAVAALSDDAELDRYTYMVAGCVGEFWTKMAAAHLPAFPVANQDEMVRLGVRFGKGLQLINILRDMAADLRIGRCYLPVAQPQLLLDPARYAYMQDVYSRWLDTALGHLDAGWLYTLRIPRSLWRLRLACIWPIWIGLGTLALLRGRNPLDPAQRAVVAQAKVNGFLVKSFLFARSNFLLDWTYQGLRRRAAGA